MSTTNVNMLPGQITDTGDLRELLYRTAGTEQYENVLQRAQQHLSTRLAGDVGQMSEREWKDVILKYITDYGVTCSLTDQPAILTNYLYHDMAGWSFVTRDNLLEQPGFEELDINSWKDIDIIVNGRRQKTDYSFLSPKHAGDIVRRMLQVTNQKFDEAVPYAVTDLGPSIRISAIRPPIIDEECGVACSIRKVSGSTISREKLLSVLSEEMLDMLLLFVHHGVSVCFSGETSTGKTTLAGYLLHTAAQTLRMYTIEEGSREWNFVQRDESGKIANSVIHTKTRPSPNDVQDVTQERLLELALRFNPTVIGVGEMRSREAYAAAEASSTGHTVITTTHADSAAEAIKRLVGLCKKAYDFSDNTLMELIATAFPIQVHQGWLPDGTRRVLEIVEVTGCENGKPTFNTLVEYHIVDNIKDAHGVLKQTIGEFRWKNPLSDRLQQKMLRKGVTRAELTRFLKA